MMEADTEWTMEAYNSRDTRNTAQCLLCHSCNACSAVGHIPLLQASCGCCLHAHAHAHHHEMHHELRSSASDITVGTNNNSVHGSALPSCSALPSPVREKVAASLAGQELTRREKKEKRPAMASPTEPAQGKKKSKDEDEHDANTSANNSDTTVSHLTRGTRQRLSLPLPQSCLPNVASPSKPSNKKAPRKNTPKKKKPAIRARKKRVPTPALLFDLERTCEDSGSKEEDSGDETNAGPSDAAADCNANASKEKAAGGKNAIINKARSLDKGPRFMLNKRHCNQKAGRFNIPARRMVSLSALKPIKATCSRSGMGLVVTYRPVFSEVTRRVRKKPDVTPVIAACANSSIRPVARKEIGTSPRTPSPYKPENPEMMSLSSCDRFKVVRKKKGGFSLKETGVKKWLQDIPHSTSGRATNNRKKSDQRGSGLKSFVTAKYTAKKNPMPGPSWNPVEFKRQDSRDRSPYNMTSSASSPSPHRPSRNKHAEASRLENAKSRASKPKDAVTEVYKSGGSRSLSSSIRQLSADSASEGWDVTGSLSTPKKPRGSRSRGKGKGGDDRSREELGHHAAASETRSDHLRRGYTRSRSPSRSTSASSRSGRAGHKETDDQRMGKRHRHHRGHHHRRESSHRGDDAQGGSSCQVM